MSRFLLNLGAAFLLSSNLMSDGQQLERITIGKNGNSFVIADSKQPQKLRPYKIWGVNYDHDGEGRLLDEYWSNDWKTVESDFREIRELGANCIRVHLQLGKFMQTPEQPNKNALEQLNRLLDLATREQLHLNITGLACYHKSNIPTWFNQLSEEDRWKCQARFWEAIAKTCSGNSAVFCYDLMNEPILPGKEPAKEWLTGELSGKFFVQRISLDLNGRTRKDVAEKWIGQMVRSIRKHDSKTLITVGVIPWALTWPKAKPLFYSADVSKHLDFVSVHFYPRKNEVDKAVEALKVYEIGKPLVVEEFFPLRCSRKELVEFMDRSKSVDGWISFYWGETANELRQKKKPSIADAITASWLEEFKRLALSEKQN